MGNPASRTDSHMAAIYELMDDMRLPTKRAPFGVAPFARKVATESARKPNSSFPVPFLMLSGILNLACITGPTLPSPSSHPHRASLAREARLGLSDEEVLEAADRLGRQAVSDAQSAKSLGVSKGLVLCYGVSAPALLHLDPLVLWALGELDVVYLVGRERTRRGRASCCCRRRRPESSAGEKGAQHRRGAAQKAVGHDGGGARGDDVSREN
eukprot:scaffold124147_cov32-Tisochrysis_lutea.AAC.1